MNIVIIKQPEVGNNLAESADECSGYESIYAHLEVGGKLLLLHTGEKSRSACFLISTENLLIALRLSAKIPSTVPVQVFSLAVPEKQLLGTVTEDNYSDPEGYRLLAKFLKP